MRAVCLVVVTALLGAVKLDAAYVPMVPSGPVEPFIAGGSASNNGDLRFMVDVIWTYRGGFLPKHSAAAVLLNPSWVLATKTATTQGYVETVHLYFGKAKGAAGKEVAMGKRFEHKDADLVLIKLKQPVVYDALNWPVNLPYAGSNYTGVEMTLAGWTNDGKELREANVKVLTEEDCKTEGVDPKKILCTKDLENTTCDTDDGTPLVQNLGNGFFRLVGIATATKGSKCPPSSENALRKYVKVSAYSNWIMDTITSN